DSTLAENIALGIAPQNIDRQRVEEVLEMASLKQFTEGLAEGLDTMIGESGCRVSGGERQRIGIARALYSQPDILFFDEATSALDKETEQSVNKSIETLSVNNRNLTIVVIAHRETSLGYCDRIINIGE
ncbi:MAG: ATP-binding cassette domain-containing protein, partial [Alistipes sp.]|nr:ATP-binding cassette domain-containing protein [Alistipes sp.]